MQRLPPLPTIQEIIRIYGLTARKRLSQNFLLDLNLTRKIVKAAGKLDGLVFEVGPGPGGITRSILNSDAERVVIIEKDGRFLPSLQTLSEASRGRLDVVLGDIMGFNLQPYVPEEYKASWDESPPNINIIGNLPFSVSTPLIIQWLNCVSTRSNVWSSGRAKMTLTFQKEVAERMVAPPRSEYRCRLSVMCQYLCDVNLKFTIPGKAFVPPPKVDVGVVKFVPKKVPLIHQPFPVVEKVCRQLFNTPNKFCRKGISTLFPPSRDDLICQLLETSGVDPQKRGFELSNEEIKNICDSYSDIVKNDEEIFLYDYRSRQSSKERRRFFAEVTQDIERQILSNS